MQDFAKKTGDGSVESVHTPGLERLFIDQVDAAERGRSVRGDTGGQVA
jgi:hypothetical protein